MIKDLITDLAYEKISLAQGLTRAKLIQSKLKSDIFKSWLINELNGYDNDQEIPEYRILNVKIVGDFVGYFDKQWRNVPLMLQELGKSLGINVYEYKESSSIKLIEDTVKQSKPGSSLRLPLDQNLVQSLSSMYRENDPHKLLISVDRIIYPSQYSMILDQTKQKFLDLLLDLEEKFPDLNDGFKMTEETRNKVQNIITNNIYGSNNPMNVAVGDKVTQTENSIKITSSDAEKLSSLGVNDDQIQELKTIIKESSHDKQALKSRAMKWLGTVSASVGARGLYDNIPSITEFVQNLF